MLGNNHNNLLQYNTHGLPQGTYVLTIASQTCSICTDPCKMGWKRFLSKVKEDVSCTNIAHFVCILVFRLGRNLEMHIVVFFFYFFSLQTVGV
jgi:hypothetical protein